MKILLTLITAVLTTACLSTTECERMCGANGVKFFDSAQRCECHSPVCK